MGKRKIPIKKIEKKSSLMVSFSKRRQGLFKKASDLCSLSGSHVAILVFSPAGNPFSFGHPSFDVVIDQYVRKCSRGNSHVSPPSYFSAIESSHSAVHLDDLNQRLADVQRQLDEEVEKNRLLKEGKVNRGWWDLDVEGTDVEQLEIFLSELQNFREVVASRAVETYSREDSLEEEEEVGISDGVSRDMEASSCDQGLGEEFGFWGSEKSIWIGDEEFLL